MYAHLRGRFNTYSSAVFTRLNVGSKRIIILHMLAYRYLKFDTRIHPCLIFVWLRVSGRAMPTGSKMSFANLSSTTASTPNPWHPTRYVSGVETGEAGPLDGWYAVLLLRLEGCVSYKR